MVLGWLAGKKLDGVASIKNEVCAWDVSVLSKTWQLARLCLLDDLQDAAEMASHLVDSGEVSAISMLIDPYMTRSEPSQR